MTAPRNPPTMQPLGPAMLVQGQAVVDMVYLINKGIQGAKRDGYPTGRFTEYLRLFYQVYEFRTPIEVSRIGHGDRPIGGDLKEYGCEEFDTIGTAEAALLSGFSRRTCQRLARDGLGVRVGRSWVLDRVGFLAHLANTEGGQHDRPAAA
jgi:hypothetical protein